MPKVTWLTESIKALVFVKRKHAVCTFIIFIYLCVKLKMALSDWLSVSKLRTLSMWFLSHWPVTLHWHITTTTPARPPPPAPAPPHGGVFTESIQWMIWLVHLSPGGKGRAGQTLLNGESPLINIHLNSFRIDFFLSFLCCNYTCFNNQQPCVHLMNYNK